MVQGFCAVRVKTEPRKVWLWGTKNHTRRVSVWSWVWDKYFGFGHGNRKTQAKPTRRHSYSSPETHVYNNILPI